MTKPRKQYGHESVTLVHIPKSLMPFAIDMQAERLAEALGAKYCTSLEAWCWMSPKPRRLWRCCCPSCGGGLLIAEALDRKPWIGNGYGRDGTCQCGEERLREALSAQGAAS
jgi:hypothetical protein